MRHQRHFANAAGTFVGFKQLEKDLFAPVGTLRLSHEYTTGIMEAILTDKLFRFNGNVMNNGLISNR